MDRCAIFNAAAAAGAALEFFLNPLLGQMSDRIGRYLSMCLVIGTAPRFNSLILQRRPILLMGAIGGLIPRIYLAFGEHHIRGGTS